MRAVARLKASIGIVIPGGTATGMVVAMVVYGVALVAGSGCKSDQGQTADTAGGAAVTSAAENEDDNEDDNEDGNEGDGEGKATEALSFWAQAAQPYRDVTLRGISEDTGPSRYVRDVLMPAFTEETGIAIEFELVSWDEASRATSNGEYDFVYVEQDWIYAYMTRDWLANLTQAFAQHPELAATSFREEDFSSYIDAFRDPKSGDLYGVPMEAFVKTYYYRTDLFDNAENKEAFAAAYGYPLAPAVTWAQYRDIAEFFTAYGKRKGIELWGGSAQAAVDHPASVYEFVESIAPGFGVYGWGMSPESGRFSGSRGGTLDSARAKEALAFWIDMLAFAPPNALQSDWALVGKTFAEGKLAQALIYGDQIGQVLAAPQMVGNVGVALPPSQPGVIEEALAGSGYIGYYDGGAFGIPKHSKRIPAALLWLQYIAQPSVQADWAAKTVRVVLLSTFDTPELTTHSDIKDYFALQKKHGQLFRGNPPLPHHGEIVSTLAPFIHGAITEQYTPAQALDLAAAAVDAELDRIAAAGP